MFGALPRERRVHDRHDPDARDDRRRGDRPADDVPAREGHSGPHAAHFWDAELAGGGALLDMASHGIEAARYLFGKEVAVREVFAWGATLVHGGRTSAEDNAVMLVRFEDDRLATMDVSWSSKGGLENRFEVYGDAGRMVQDITATSLRAFIEQPAGYLGEKADIDTGWVFPVPDETYVHGHDAMMRHVVESFRAGTPPRETLRRRPRGQPDHRCGVPLDAHRAAGSRRPWPTRRRCGSPRGRAG